MEMNSVSRAIVGLVVMATFLGSALVVVPTRVAASEYSGTSPSFSTGSTWALDLGTLGPGFIVEWSWASSDSLIFSMTLDGTAFPQSNNEGFVTWTTGHWELQWYNNNWFFSATVSYWVAAFTPLTTVATPLDGTWVNSAMISVQGVSDHYSIGVLVGPDAMHLREASWSGDDWEASYVALNEGQQSILVRTYYWLDYYGYHNITYDQTVHVVVDSVPPELVITAPANGTYMKGDSDVSWQCSDSNGIVKSEIKFDAWGWQDIAGTTYQASLADGEHTVQVRVTDPAGNQVIRLATFTADSTPPGLTFLFPLEGSYSSNGTVAWRATDNYVVQAPFRVDIDSAGWTFTEGGTPIYHLDVPDGPHSFQMEVRDGAENTVVRTVNFTVDRTMPTISISGPTTGVHIRGDYADVTWQSSDNLGIVSTEMKIDGKDWTPVTGLEAKHVWFSSGYHVVQVRVTDHAGNQAISSTSFKNDNGAFSFGGPLYGLPTIAIIVGVILVGLFIALTVMKKRHALAAPPPQPPATPPSAQ